MAIVDLGNCQKVIFENLNFKEFFFDIRKINLKLLKLKKIIFKILN